MPDLEYSANGSQYVCYLLSEKARKRIREMIQDEINDFFACPKEFFSRFIIGLEGKEVSYKQIHEQRDPWRARTLH